VDRGELAGADLCSSTLRSFTLDHAGCRIFAFSTRIAVASLGPAYERLVHAVADGRR
jgi:hypothetical protein